MGPLLGWWLGRGEIEASDAIGEMLGRHLAHNRDRAARMGAAAVALVEALHGRGTGVTLLKGAHTAGEYFPDAATRPASDIDLLIDPAASAEAEATLEAAGYVACRRGRRESTWRLRGAPQHSKSLSLVHRDDPWSVDLHTSLNVMVSAGAPVADLDVAQPMSSQRRWTRSPSASTLEQPLLLLHLAVHAGAGLQNLTLLRLVELHLVIRRDTASGLLSWDDFVELGQRTGTLGYVWPALQLCEKLAAGTVPQSVLRESRRRVPPAVRRVIEKVTPATAQRIDRTSLAEHFMWASGVSGRLRQVAFDLLPSRSWGELLPIYQKRMWQLLRGGGSR